jgi:signal transduction histidine kinase
MQTPVMNPQRSPASPVEASGPTAGSLTVRHLGGGVLLVATVAAVVVAVEVHTKTGVPAISAVGLGVAVAWAMAGFATWDGPSFPVASVGALAGAGGLLASRLGGHSHHAGSVSATVLGALLLALWFHWLQALPAGHLVGRPRLWAVVLIYGAAAAVGGGLALADDSLGPLSAIAGVAVLTLASSPAISRSYSRCANRDRERFRWLGAGAVVAVDLAVVIAVLHALVGWPVAVGPAAAATVALVPAAMLAGHSPRLSTYGGRVLVKVLSIAGFTLIMSAIYLVVVLGLGTAPSGPGDREALGLSMVAASIAAVAYVPARERLMLSATRMVYGARQAPDEVVRTFGSRLTRAVPMDELLLQLVESLTKTMGLTSAEVYTGAGDVLERAAAVPDTGPRSMVVSERERPVVTRAGVSGNAWVSVWLPSLLDRRGDRHVRVAPIRNAGELLGLLVVERPETADPFSEDDDRVLGDLAREVGLAFHNVQLDAALQTTLAELRAQAVELRQSRARIVATGDAERRRVERNLHDGAQQNLVALAVSLRLARDLLASDPAATAEMLESLSGEVQQTIQELRELAHGIYPPLLVDSGLAPALGAAASRNPLNVSVDASGLGRYPAEVEAAVYFCCLEALQNAAKHAGEAHVEVRLWEESGGLLFSVSDDGPGFDTEVAQRGHGFVNMADRLGAIGGSVRWESRPGEGARVRGSVPLG